MENPNPLRSRINTAPARPRVAVIGAGGWGTALAIVLARQGLRPRLWVREDEVWSAIRARRENLQFLPGLRVPEEVEASQDLAGCLAGAEIVVTAMPSHVCRPMLARMAACLEPAMLLVSATKGLEDGTLARMSEVIAEELAPRFAARVAVLSGPTFAPEVARGEPTALVAASRDAGLAERVQQAFSGPNFRVYTNADPAGVELGASLKNVIAIAAGICAGMGLGSNALAALITRGLAEISRLAEAAGGRRETLAGLAGLGDLVLTCTGQLSRNRRVGVELAQGRRLGEILAGMHGMVAEGVKTTAAARELSRRRQIEMPITETMYRVLFEDLPPRQGVKELMERRLRPE